MRTRVLLACSRLDVGGTEVYIKDMAKHGMPEYDIHVLCKKPGTGSLEPEIRALGAQVICIPIGFINPLAFLRLVGFLRAGKYSSVCDFNGSFSGLVMIAATIARIPHRVTFFRQSREFFRPTWYRSLYLMFSRLAVLWFSTRILSNSKEAIGRTYPTAHSRSTKFMVVYNGLPQTKANGVQVQRWRAGGPAANGRRFRMATVGRSLPEKNHRLLIEVFVKLRQIGFDVEMLLIGRGIQESLAKMIVGDTIEHVHFLGERRDVEELLLGIDLFLFPSVSEGQPNALLEAISIGCDCIASDIPEIRECVEWLGQPITLLNPLKPDDWVSEISRLYLAGCPRANQNVVARMITHGRTRQIAQVFELLTRHD